MSRVSIIRLWLIPESTPQGLIHNEGFAPLLKTTGASSRTPQESCDREIRDENGLVRAVREGKSETINTDRERMEERTARPSPTASVRSVPRRPSLPLQCPTRTVCRFFERNVPAKTDRSRFLSEVACVAAPLRFSPRSRVHPICQFHEIRP
jgi:hypothetical protein